nr:unnamed protein product [Haemonchus contortus]
MEDQIFVNHPFKTIERSSAHLKPRRLCTVCGRWTTAIYAHMNNSHNWDDHQINRLKMEIRKESVQNMARSILF